MSNHYKAFFGLKRDPFTSNIPVDEILETTQLKGIYERISYSVRLGAVCLVTGEVGAGKSTALRWSMERFHPSEFKILWITATTGSIIEIYRQLLRELKIDKSSTSKAILTRTIRKEVSELINEKKQKPIMVVDEASLLRLDVLVELHTIMQFEGDSKPWFPIVLSGQVGLEDMLRYRKAAPLSSRVVARGALTSLTRAELDSYLLHHLNLAGLPSSPFSEEALTAIYQGSGGIFRRANHLARGALIAASKEKSLEVSSDHVRLSSSELM